MNEQKRDVLGLVSLILAGISLAGLAAFAVCGLLNMEAVFSSPWLLILSLFTLVCAVFYLVARGRIVRWKKNLLVAGIALNVIEIIAMVMMFALLISGVE